MSGINWAKTDSGEHKRITALIYGESGIGKTTLATTLGCDDSRILYIAADPGYMALRKHSITMALIGQGDIDNTMSEVATLIQASKKAAGDGKLDWIVVDGIDEIGEAVLRWEMKQTKDPRKAYGEMADKMSAWIKTMRDIRGCSTLFITHIDKLQDDLGRLLYHPSFPGQKATERLVDWFDLVGCMRIAKEGDPPTARRLIQFKPEADERYKCKDRSGALENFEEPSISAIFEKIHGAQMAPQGETSPQSKNATTKESE